MSSLFGFHFAWPFGFMLALLLPALVLAYLRRERRTRIVVSSLLLFAGLPKRARAKRRFKPPLQFFLELLALIALLVAIAGPFVTTDAARIAILLDSSLSMNAKDLRGQTRTDQVVAQLATRLAQEDRRTSFTLYRSAPALTQLGEPDVAAAEVIPLIQAEGRGAVSDSLELEITQLLRDESFDTVLVLSDRTPAGATPGESGKIEFISSSTRVANIYVEDFDFVDASKRALAVTVGASSESRMRAQLTVYGTNQVGGSEQLLYQQRVVVTPPNALRLEIPLKDAAGLQFFRAAVSVDEQTENGLAEDDQAWLASERASASQLALIGYPEGSAGLEALSSGTVDTFTPAEYSGLSLERISSYDVLLFYGVVPSEAPSRPALVVLPPEGSDLLPVQGTIEDVVISSWQVEHPLLRYLSVPLLKPSRAVRFAVPPWAQAVIRAEQGPIAIAGVRQENRLLGLGFEVLPFEGRKTPTSSILLLNALQWLSGGAEFSTNLQVGSSIRLSLDRNWIIRQPDGSLVTFTAGGGRAEQYSFPSPGLFVVTSSVPGSRKSESRVYTVQGYMPAESQTWFPPALSVADSTEQTVADTAQKELYWPYLVVVALALLSLQMLLTTGRWRSRWS